MASEHIEVFGMRSPSALAEAIMAKIRGRDLPAGTCLDPARLAPVMHAKEQQVSLALQLVEQAGAAEVVGDVWVVCSGRKGPASEILCRGKPALLAVARLAAEHATPAQAAAIAAARDRLGGVSGDGAPATRAAAYRETIELVALASGSRFHADALHQMLEEAAQLFIPIASRDMEMNPRPNPDGELARLARAIMASDADAAEAAMKDHLLLLSCHMNALPEL